MLNEAYFKSITELPFNEIKKRNIIGKNSKNLNLIILLKNAMRINCFSPVLLKRYL